MMFKPFTDNPGSWKIMEKIGLIYKGSLKPYVSKSERFYDLAQDGLLKDEYLEKWVVQKTLL
ncbi:hypothetical protein ABE65_000970 [Fictibacillus phosphorivorans]|uniref:N-acetyltransferase domain-containing protein n=1 Tax=Fictibacillus phosphorivorans TaxID=1221500 RepID=A0A161IIB0_9BACL|nr:hypothetical protein ABE65_000970 [Fictibacillus phosphorivorans]